MRAFQRKHRGVEVGASGESVFFAAASVVHELISGKVVIIVPSIAHSIICHVALREGEGIEWVVL